MDAVEFLTRFYGEHLINYYISVNRIDPAGKGLKARWFQDIVKAGEYAGSVTGENVYFSMGIFAKAHGASKGKAADVVGLGAFGCDIDIDGGNHKKKNLAPSIDEAMWILDTAFDKDCRPSLVTQTGGGIQAFWIFHEPWIFADDFDAQEGRELYAKMVRYLQSVAMRKNYAVDPTVSVAQILRVVGTYNQNHGTPFLVKPLIDTGQTYDPHAFDDYLMATSAGSVSRSRSSSKGKSSGKKKKEPSEAEEYGFVLDPNAQVPEEKYKELTSVTPRFGWAFEKLLDQQLLQRPPNDASLNVYDMILANYAAENYWTRQEIANLIVAFRRKHAEKPEDLQKASRYRYIKDTIDKAMSRQIDDDKLSPDAEVFYKKCRALQQNPPKTKKEAEKIGKEMYTSSRAHCKQLLGIDIVKILRYDSNPPDYELVLGSDKRIMVGKSNVLLKQEALRQLLFDHCQVHFNSKKAGVWNKICQYFLWLIENVETPEETRPQDAMQVYLKEYLSSRRPGTEVDEACQRKDPFIYNGETAIDLNEFRDFVANTQGEKYSNERLGIMLTALGGRKGQVKFYRVTGERAMKRVFFVTEVLKGGQHVETGKGVSA